MSDNLLERLFQEPRSVDQVATSLRLEDILDKLDLLPDNEGVTLYMSGIMLHRLPPLIKQGRRLERRCKITRRQHRAAFRRRKRGLACS